MKNFILGFFVCFAACSVAYQVWEAKRHVPILIQEKQIPVPVPYPVPSASKEITIPETENGIERQLWDT